MAETSATVACSRAAHSAAYRPAAPAPTTATSARLATGCREEARDLVLTPAGDPPLQPPEGPARVPVRGASAPVAAPGVTPLPPTVPAPDVGPAGAVEPDPAVVPAPAVGPDVAVPGVRPVAPSGVLAAVLGAGAIAPGS